MRPTLALGRLIADYMTRPGSVLAPSTKASFVTSGLRTAQTVHPQTREDILSDVADVLACDVKDLAFLFSDIDDENEDFVVPNYREIARAG
jgi:hypothetical protein